MSFTIDDVGERPGKPLLTDAEKQVIADEWNANVIAAEERRNNPELQIIDKINAMFEVASQAIKADALNRARERGRR